MFFTYPISNLHSTMVLLKCELAYLHDTNTRQSTFHYGSIKMVHSDTCKIMQYTSTFHYGSIKIIN